MTTHRWLRGRLACVAASSAAFALAVIILGSITPGYSQWSDAVSRLGSPGERYALAARIIFVTYGLLVAAGASTLQQYAGGQERRMTRGGNGATATPEGTTPLPSWCCYYDTREATVRSPPRAGQRHTG